MKYWIPNQNSLKAKKTKTATTCLQKTKRQKMLKTSQTVRKFNVFKELKAGKDTKYQIKGLNQNASKASKQNRCLKPNNLKANPNQIGSLITRSGTNKWTTDQIKGGLRKHQELITIH